MKRRRSEALGDTLRNAAGCGIHTNFSALRHFPALVQKLNSATVATIDTPVVQVRIQESGADLVVPDRRAPNYLQKIVESETTGVSMD